MNRSLIIYETDGTIISQISGVEREPKGVPFIWIEMPQGKYLTKIDVSSEVHTPIFEDFPKSEIALLQEQVDALNIAIAQIMGV